MAKVTSVSGVHQDGAVDAIVTFELNGEVAHDYVTIPFSGVRPVIEELDAAAKVLTNCKTAKVTSYAIVDLGYSEDQYSCPDAAHVTPMNAPTAITPNYYEPQQPSKLNLAGVVVAKTKVVRLNQTTRTGQSYPN